VIRTDLEKETALNTSEIVQRFPMFFKREVLVQFVQSGFPWREVPEIGPFALKFLQKLILCDADTGREGSPKYGRELA
jgi:hypothetical protein